MISIKYLQLQRFISTNNRVISEIEVAGSQINSDL
jgi:hypothetical protein